MQVVNARHIKAVPGRKTDVKDAEWIADLLRHGLLTPSFIPDRTQRDLQEVVRYRRSLVAERAREANRIQKVLEGATIKLTSVISDVVGISGRAMLQGIIDGVDEPSELASRVRTPLKASPADLEAALRGAVGAHHRHLLRIQLEHITFLDQQVTHLDEAIAEQMRPCAAELARLDTIPGIGVRAAQEIIAAIGTDMSRFPSAAHLASWAKLCPGLKDSGGKRTSARIGHGNTQLRTVLVEAAWAASHTKTTYLAAQYHRLAARKGAKRALIAVAHSILVIVYHILKQGSVYQDLGANYFDHRSKEATIRRAVQRLERLGVTVCRSTLPNDLFHGRQINVHQGDHSMPSTAQLVTFGLTSFILIAVPGPSVLFVISRSLSLGRPGGLATVIGNSVGEYVLVIAVAIGLGPLVEDSIVAFTVIKFAGAAYLIYLGIQALRHRKSVAAALDAGQAHTPTRRILRDGFIVGVTNPKAIIFFAALLPQFVDRSAGHIPLQLLLLGCVFVAIALVSDTVWALAADAARSRLARSPRRLELIGGAGGPAMIGIGARLAVTGRHD